MGNISEIEGTIQESLPNLSSEQASLISNMFAESQADCDVHTDQILEFFGIVTSFSITMATLIGYLSILHVLTFLGLRLTSFKDKK